MLQLGRPRFRPINPADTPPARSRTRWRRVVIGFAVPTSLLIGCAVTFGLQRHAGGIEASYLRSTACASPAQAAAQDCFTIADATVSGRTPTDGKSGAIDHLDLAVVGFGAFHVELASGDIDALYSSAQTGTHVDAKVWNGSITRVQNGPLVIGTGSNPVYVADEYDLWWHLLGLLGGGVLATQLIDAAVRRRTISRLEASIPELTRHGDHAVTTYRRLPSALQAASGAPAALVMGSFLGYGWGHGWGGALLGSLAALTAGAGAVFWRLPDTLEVSPDGLTVRTRTSSTSVTWGLVTVVGVERSRGLEVRYLAERTGQLRPARLRLARFAAANLGLGLIVARGLETYRETHPAPAPPTAPADGPSDPGGAAGAADATLGPRLAAWALDVVYMSVGAFVLMVIVSLIAEAAGHKLGGAGGSALVLGCIPLTLAGYLGVLWRRGRTWGMRPCRLELEGTSPTGRPTWRQVGFRLLAAVPSMVTVVPVALLISPRQPFHDRVSGTRMVRVLGDVRARPRNRHTPGSSEV